MKLKEGFVLRRIGGHAMVVPVGSQTVDFRCMITLNDTGAFLWKQLETDCTVEQLTKAIQSEYEVTAEVAVQDVARFIDQLRQADLLV